MQIRSYYYHSGRHKVSYGGLIFVYNDVWKLQCLGRWWKDMLPFTWHILQLQREKISRLTKQLRVFVQSWQSWQAYCWQLWWMMLHKSSNPVSHGWVDFHVCLTAEDLVVTRRSAITATTSNKKHVPDCPVIPISKILYTSTYFELSVSSLCQILFHYADIFVWHLPSFMS